MNNTTTAFDQMLIFSDMAQGKTVNTGIVFLPDGRKYVLVLLSKDMEDEKAGVNAMANVSKMVYDYFKKSKD